MKKQKPQKIIKPNKNEENKNKKNLIEINKDKRQNIHIVFEEQKEKNRNKSKNAKKTVESKIKKKEEKKDIKDISSNLISNQKINDNNDVNEVENFLKNKTKLSVSGKNFLGSSINYILMNEFNVDDINSKTDIKKNYNKKNKIDNIIYEDIDKEKEKEKEESKFNLNLNNILIPMLNNKKENNCFLNVLIQVLFNLESFRKYIINYFDNNFSNIKDEVVYEFCNLINLYDKEQIKYEDIQKTKIPILSVNFLRKKLNLKFGNYFKGECGDPLESLEHIFNSIHEEFSQNYSFKNEGVGDCPIHQYFYLDLIDNQICKNCKIKTKRPYNKDCYMYQIFISEISKRINDKNLSFEKINTNLFQFIKEHNRNYDISNIRINGCKCPEINYIRKLNLSKVNNSYVIINLTWSDSFPDLKDILNIFASLPLSDKNKHLFSIYDEKDSKLLYIKSIILYGIYHYICVIYLNKFKKWGIIDDKTIKFIDKYYDLVDYLLRNHLSPVGIIYSYDICDKIEDNEIQLNILTKEKYLQILKFCKGVDNSKDIKLSFISKSRESMNEINENYLDNNLFYNSFINQVINSSSSSNNEEAKDDNKNKKSSLNSLSSFNKRSSEEENEKNNDLNNSNIIKVDMKLKREGKNLKSSVVFFDE